MPPDHSHAHHNHAHHNHALAHPHHHDGAHPAQVLPWSFLRMPIGRRLAVIALACALLWTAVIVSMR